MGVLVFLVIVGLIIWVAVATARKNNEIIECVNCHNKMTRGNFKKLGRCPTCGSDLIRSSGVQAKRD